MTRATTDRSIGRMLMFAERARAVMIEKGLTTARRTCPWCEVKSALRIELIANSNPDFRLTCTVTEFCMRYDERETTIS